MICKKCGITMQIKSEKQVEEGQPTLILYICPKCKNKIHKIDWNIRPIV